MPGMVLSSWALLLQKQLQLQQLVVRVYQSLTIYVAHSNTNPPEPPEKLCLMSLPAELRVMMFEQWL